MEPLEVTNEFVVMMVDDGVVITGIGVVDDVDDDVETEGVGHEGPKRVVNTVTGTSTVNVANTVTVVALPE